MPKESSISVHMARNGKRGRICHYSSTERHDNDDETGLWIGKLMALRNKYGGARKIQASSY